MPFVPRSQLDQKQNTTTTTAMSVVEHNLQKQPVAIPQSLPTSTHTDEQIAELNELLAHVLDELSSMKEALHANTKKAKTQTHELKAPSKRPQQKSDETAAGDVEARDESEEEEAHAPSTPRTHKGTRLLFVFLRNPRRSLSWLLSWLTRPPTPGWGDLLPLGRRDDSQNPAPPRHPAPTQVD